MFQTAVPTANFFLPYTELFNRLSSLMMYAIIGHFLSTGPSVTVIASISAAVLVGFLIVTLIIVLLLVIHIHRRKSQSGTFFNRHNTFNVLRAYLLFVLMHMYNSSTMKRPQRVILMVLQHAHTNWLRKMSKSTWSICVLVYTLYNILKWCFDLCNNFYTQT